MATGTLSSTATPWAFQDIANDEHLPTAGAKKVVLVSTTGTAIGQGTSPVLVQQVDATGGSGHPALYQNILLASFTTLAAGTTTGTTTTGIGGYRNAALFLDVTALTGDTCTLSVFVDSRLDGTNYINVGAYALVTSAGGTGRAVMVLTKEVGTAVAVGSVQADAGAGTARQIGWGDDLRIRRIISGDTASVSARVWLLLNR